MEHRHDLTEILLSGLSDDARKHVVEIINGDDESKLHELRARSDCDEDAFDVSRETCGDLSKLGWACLG